MNKLTRHSNFSDLKKEISSIRTQAATSQHVEQLKAFIELLQCSLSKKSNIVKTQAFKSNGQ